MRRASEEVPIRLGPGLDFIVLGECDADCDDLGPAAHDSAGNEIAFDIMLDEFPFVVASPVHNGSYRLRVIMAG